MTADPVVVVGSGPSSLHFAQTLLARGRRVRMLDVGRRGPEPMLPDLALDELKERLDAPVDYFLGKDYGSLILPGSDEEYYGFPPGKEYVFEEIAGHRFGAEGFAPLVSYAAGGLAQAWTGGSYPFTDEELHDFPFGLRELLPHYAEVARRIGMSGERDDLAAFFPWHDGLQPSLDLDEHSRVLMEQYERRRAFVNGKLRAYVGRSRVAVLSRAHRGREACGYLGRCLWGCPTRSLYTPSVTLAECREDPGFEYVSGVAVTHFEANAEGRIHKVVARDLSSGTDRRFEVGTLALGAGTLASARIFLRSLRLDRGETPQLRGLMDNRQAMMPFVNLRMVGRPFDSRTYQYHQLAIGLDTGDPQGYVHGLVTTLKTALVHPLVQSIPTAVGTALGAFRGIHAALGLVNINFADHRRPDNAVWLETGAAGDAEPVLRIRYSPDAREPERVASSSDAFRKLLRALGCVAPRGMFRMRPMGASVHYAGTVPMTYDGGPSTCDPLGRSRDFANLLFVDGTTFPSLPAKNLTFTLMANATRIAEGIA